MAATLLSAGCRPAERAGESTGKPVLGEKEIAFATQKLATMRNGVELLSFAPGKIGTTEEEVFFDQLAAVQPKITRTSRSLEGDAAMARELGISGAPSVIIKRGDNTRLRYFGMPSGYEFAAFLEAVERLSADQPAITAKGAAALADLRVPVNIKVFVTPS
jgi:hypothetical protein